MSLFHRLRVLGRSLLRDVRGDNLATTTLMTMAGVATVAVTIPSMFQSGQTAASTVQTQAQALQNGATGGGSGGLGSVGSAIGGLTNGSGFNFNLGSNGVSGSFDGITGSFGSSGASLSAGGLTASGGSNGVSISAGGSGSSSSGSGSSGSSGSSSGGSPQSGGILAGFNPGQTSLSGGAINTSGLTAAQAAAALNAVSNH